MKYALITGANKGIGFETARHLLKHGYYVFVTARNAVLGQDAIQSLHSDGLTNCSLILLDVTSRQSVDDAAKQVTDKTNKLHALVNNAGISGRFPDPGEILDPEEVQRVFDTNVFGVIRVTNALLPLLQKAEDPVIVNVTSDLGSLTLHNNPEWEFYQLKGTAYGPSKTALNAYTVAMAHQLKPLNIKINAISPGFTATDFNGHRGYRNVVDSAAVIAKYAMLPADGPTGIFAEAGGIVEW